MIKPKVKIKNSVNNLQKKKISDIDRSSVLLKRIRFLKKEYRKHNNKRLHNTI